MPCRLTLAAPAFAALTLVAGCGAAERTQTQTTLQDKTTTTTPTAGGVPTVQTPVPPPQGPGEFPAETDPDRANRMQAAQDGERLQAQGKAN